MRLNYPIADQRPLGLLISHLVQDIQRKEKEIRETMKREQAEKENENNEQEKEKEHEREKKKEGVKRSRGETENALAGPPDSSRYEVQLTGLLEKYYRAIELLLSKGADPNEGFFEPPLFGCLSSREVHEDEDKYPIHNSGRIEVTLFSLSLSLSLSFSLSLYAFSFSLFLFLLSLSLSLSLSFSARS